VHIKTISKLSPAARAEFLDVVKRIEIKYKLKSYAIGMRSGNMRFNGGSVEHIHAQIIVGDITKIDHQPIKFKMSNTL
jgi:diadenosine tetraphosphate (Ap4A) HIT family hydrolase